MGNMMTNQKQAGRRRRLEALLELVAPEDPVLDVLSGVVERRLARYSAEAEAQQDDQTGIRTRPAAISRL